MRRGDVRNMSAAGRLDGLLESLSSCLDAESARRVIGMQIAARVQDEIERLAEGANESMLTEEEQSEYEALIDAAEFISVLKLKARTRLNNSSPIVECGDPSECQAAGRRSLRVLP